MSTGEKRPLPSAREDAEELRQMFDGCYERWCVAGSVRRRRPQVGDVEHVVIPRFAEVSDGGLFGSVKQVNLLWQRAEELVQRKVFGKAVYKTANGAQHRWGDKYRGLTYSGFTHEIFTATPENWGAILLIRTGPAHFSKDMVTKFLAGGMYRQQDGVLINVATGQPVNVPTEEEYFRLLGMPFISPEARQ